ncbi:MAG TPA: proton-conducting transporter membrane subunit [Vicinamibacterales bacterium]|nr:proton-conducting transporter membrane subunit [Vicinamibacterales bacterium]
MPLTSLVLVGVGSPALLFALLGGLSLVNRPLPEKWTGRLTAGSVTISCAALSVALAAYGTTGGTRLLSYGAWSSSHEGGIAIEFLVDRLSLAFAALSAAIVGVVSAFSNRYLHREPGYNRYFVLLAMFVTGMLLVALAGNVAVLFIGWEFVGLSSALLVAFFHERPAPLANALRVLAVYRISDAAMLSAAVLLRHAAGTDSLSLLFGGAGAVSTAGLTGVNATIIGVLLIIAVAGKSALLPFSSWLPRAMEGPTPSSAVYYGSLSIHAGCFLLLRSAPLLEQAPAARLLAGTLGAATAVFAGITTRVQSDAKSSLAYASLTQVGIIVVEIAIGWYTIAFVHLAGHACFRLLQFLSAPNVLHDLHGMEDAIGNRASASRGYLDLVTSDRARRHLYLFALERGFLDSLLDRVVVEPFTRFARQLTRLDAWLCDAVLPRRRPILVEGGEDRDE